MSLPLTVSPCVVSSAFGMIEQAEARLMPLHTTPGKGQCRPEAQFWRGTRRNQGAISPVTGLARESTLFLRRTPFPTLSALTPFCRLKKSGAFPAFFWKRAFQGSTGPTTCFHGGCHCDLSL